MRIAVMGAGGVGGYYGGLLAQAGNEVALIARGAHLEAIRTAGLRVESPHGDLHVRPALATSDPAEVGPVELVIFAVKTYDLETAGRAAVPLIGPQTVVLPLENGLDAPAQLGALLGEEHVLPALTHISSTVVAPGVIRQSGTLRRITLGEADGRLTPRALALRDVLAAGGIEVVLTSDIQAALWSKFVFMATAGGVSAAARLPMGPLLATPETAALFRAGLEEVAVLARAVGVALPGTLVDDILRLCAGFPPQTKPSTLVDLEAGRRLELEALSGAVVRRGEAAGVDTPVHRILYALLKPWAGGRG